MVNQRGDLAEMKKASSSGVPATIEFKNNFYYIEEFIDFVKSKKDRLKSYDRCFMYDIYTENKTPQKIHSKMKVYVGETPTFDEDDNEVYPEDVRELGLTFLYSCDNFQDVVDLAYKQKPNATFEEVIRCLNHYSDFDDFLDLN